MLPGHCSTLTPWSQPRSLFASFQHSDNLWFFAGFAAVEIWAFPFISLSFFNFLVRFHLFPVTFRTFFRAVRCSDVEILLPAAATQLVIP